MIKNRAKWALHGQQLWIWFEVKVQKIFLLNIRSLYTWGNSGISCYGPNVMIELDCVIHIYFILTFLIYISCFKTSETLTSLSLQVTTFIEFCCLFIGELPWWWLSIEVTSWSSAVPRFILSRRPRGISSFLLAGGILATYVQLAILKLFDTMVAEWKIYAKLKKS